MTVVVDVGPGLLPTTAARSSTPRCTALGATSPLSPPVVDDGERVGEPGAERDVLGAAGSCPVRRGGRPVRGAR